MSRLNVLLNVHKHGLMKVGGIGEEFIELLVAELNARAVTVEMFGDQLIEIKAANALLKQQLKKKGVN